MTFNMKMLLLLALTTLSMASASTGSLRNLRKLESDDDAPKDITVTHFKGHDGEADEVDIDLKLKTCKKGSEKCAAIEGDHDIEEVSLAMFTSLMAEGMVSALEKDEDEDGRRLEAQRELWCRTHCVYAKVCGSYACWYQYVCRTRC